MLCCGQMALPRPCLGLPHTWLPLTLAARVWFAPSAARDKYIWRMGRAHMVFNGSAIQWPRVEVAAGIGSEFTKQRNTCALPPNRSHPARSIKILLHTLRELLLGVHDQANDVCRMLVNQRQEFVGFFVTSQGILNARQSPLAT